MSWQGSIFLDAMVKVRGVKQLSVSCVYVVRAKSWWEIGKNDPACLYLTVYCPPAARRAAV